MTESETGLRQIFQILGRVEQKQDDLNLRVSELQSMGLNRDMRIEDLNTRIRDDSQERRNEAQVNSNRMEAMQTSVGRAEVAIKKVGERVEKLEIPVARAALARQNRRRLWVKVTAVAAGVGTLVWFFLEPVYKIFVEGWLRRWFDSH